MVLIEAEKHSSAFILFFVFFGVDLATVGLVDRIDIKIHKM